MRALLLLLTMAMIAVLSFGLQAENKPAHAATTFTVNSTHDPGSGGCDATECTLREAITAANNTPGADTIAFHIPVDGSNYCSSSDQACAILLSSALPEITQPVTIDGYTQPLASPNTLTQPDQTNAALKIAVVLAELHFGAGSSNSVIRGLAFETCGASNCSAIILDGGTGYKVEGNFLGTNYNGMESFSDHGALGVTLHGTRGSTIGGATPGTRNIISDHTFADVSVDNGSGNTIEGNLIGTDKDGKPLGGGGSGIVVSSGTGNRILSNSIYSHNKLGIDLKGQPEDANGVTANDPKDPDIGPNRLQNYPDITSAQWFANSTSISWTLESTPSTRHKKRTFIIQFFSSPAGEADPSGFGEGKTFLGQVQVRTDRRGHVESGDFPFVPAQEVSVGQYITATATNKRTGDTSEFSRARVVEELVIGGHHREG